MTTNFVIDLGNTRAKWALFSGQQILKHGVCVFDAIADCVVQQKPNNICVGSVGANANTLIETLQKLGVPVFEVTNQTPLTFTNSYATPNTLGVDRIAAIVGAQELFSNKPNLVIDAGTCITYDFISETNNYIGGAIAPGLQMRYKSLNYFTHKLPLLEAEFPTDFEGNETSQAIHSGIFIGLIDEINGKINRYIQRYGNVNVLLTGGDADILAKHLKSNIFAAPLLVLQGLNKILLLNVNKG